MQYESLQSFLNAAVARLRFDSVGAAFCTQFSWFSVAKRERLGIEELYLQYNQTSRLLSPNLLTFRVERPDGASERHRERTDSPLAIEENDGLGFSGKTAYLDTDIICYHAHLNKNSKATCIRATLLLPETDPQFERRAEFNGSRGLLTVKTLVSAADPAEPDPHHALTLCLTIPPAFSGFRAIVNGTELSASDGAFVAETDGPLVISFSADATAVTDQEQTFVLGIGEGPSADKIESRMPAGRFVDSALSLRRSIDWLSGALDELTIDRVARKLQFSYTKAAHQILTNTKAQRGQLGRLTCSPARGYGSCHRVLDACFATLGAAHFSERVAEDYLTALCEAQEPNGRIPRFACATWCEQQHSHPPLIAWSALRLYERYGNKEFIRDVYEPLCRSIDWWFSARDLDGDGVVEYLDALESGWDNSPRFDRGPVAAVDLNAFINREMKALAAMAPVLAREHESAQWERRAAEHSQRILERLLDREDELFYDRLVVGDQLNKVLTPASFTPLWTGIRVSRELTHHMIARYLINPRHFFGSRPFPTVAYSDRNYRPDQLWGGATHPGIAWMMTEILRIYGFEHEHREALHKLIEMIEHNPLPHAAYNSATGAPLGAQGATATASVFMEMARASGR